MNQGTILAVDDTLASLKLLADILTAEGYQVHPADSGELALASVAASLPELILLDIRMPGMDGFEVLRRLKAQEQRRDIPVILLTAFTEIENRVEGFKLGAVDFISKPFQRDELLARVHTHLELFRLRTRLEHQSDELRQAYKQLQIATSAERKQAEQQLRIAATAFESQESMVITDADGVILRVNQAFTETTGYTAEEAVGQTPRMLRSGRHNADFYRAMWETIHRTGKWQGEIWDRRKNGEVYPKWLSISAVKGEDGVVTNYVGSHIDITERKAAEEDIYRLAFYDPLTRLPNRRLLLERLQQAVASSARNGLEGAVLFIDLDNFKTLNDTLGHDMGDLLLQQVAQRLVSCVREGDTVARLGGDEFVVMLENLSEHALEAAAQTEAIGEKILTTLNQPYQLATHEYHSTPSVVLHS